jgi:hypothetical protein
MASGAWNRDSYQQTQAPRGLACVLGPLLPGRPTQRNQMRAVLISLERYSELEKRAA